MVTAAVLKAAKLIVASAKAANKTVTKHRAKKLSKVAKNPAPRIGTKKPSRASQVTGFKPTKRLVARRKANTEEGYFPNPLEIEKAYGVNPSLHQLPYLVQTSQTGEVWTLCAAFAKSDHAKAFATIEAKSSKLQWRVVKA